MDGTTLANALLIIFGIMTAAYIVVVVVSMGVSPILRWFASLGELAMRPVMFTKMRDDATTRRRRIDEEIDREIGQADPWGRQARADVIEAAVLAQRIRILDEKFRKTVRTCNARHWSVAKGIGAADMSEAARHPLCAQLRQRVIDLAETLTETIEEYPLLLDSHELVQLHVALPRIAPTCIACPYWTATVHDAPRLCPPARALTACGPSGVRSNPPVIDAEVLDGD